jgi:mevalonate kinase
MGGIRVSVPGKLHLMGEHAVVYGKPALLAAIDKRCHVVLIPRSDKKIQIFSENLQREVKLTINEILENTFIAQKEWERFKRERDQSILKAITKDPIAYLIIAIGETLLYYNQKLMNGFTINVSSDIPIGAGLGSSAAIAVSISAAITLFLSKPLDKWSLHELSVLIEQKKHGNPSGSDPAAVLHGNLVWFRKESEVLKVIQPVPFGIVDPIASGFYLVDTGCPIESTGEMVAFVRELYEQKLDAVGRVFEDLEKLTRDMVMVIKNNHEESLIQVVRQGERNLEHLEIVPEQVKTVIRAIESSGGAGKISGGGGKVKGAGNILVYHPRRRELDRILKSFSLQAIPIRLGAAGLTIH